MEYKNINWEIITLKQREKKNKIEKKIITIWKKCCYVWKIDWKDNIVFFEWYIIWEEWEYYICNMRDRNIFKEKDYFIIKIIKEKITILIE